MITEQLELELWGSSKKENEATVVSERKEHQPRRSVTRPAPPLNTSDEEKTFSPGDWRNRKDCGL